MVYIEKSHFAHLNNYSKKKKDLLDCTNGGENSNIHKLRQNIYQRLLSMIINKVMDDDCGLAVSVPRKTTKKRKLPNDFDIVDSQPWYHDSNEISDLLASQLESIHTKLQDSAVQDVVQFVSNYKYTAERVPVITLFTGFSSSDHRSVISQVAENLVSDEKINCCTVNLNPTKTSSLKSLIENVVYDFVNNEHGDSSDEEGTAVIAKSKCSLLLLSKWYLNNYASLDNLNETDDRQITHLVIIIRDIGIFPRQVLNDFLKTISSFRNRLPFMFLMGVPYTLNTLEKRFTSQVHSKLAIYPFQSRPSVAFLDKVLEEVFLSENCVFHMGPNVFKKLSYSYMNYNFSVKEFIRGAKLCVLEHFSQSPAHATFCCDPENNNISDRIDGLTDDDIILILDLPSMQKYNTKRKMNKDSKLTVSSPNVKDELKKLYDEFNICVIRFNAAVQCLNLLMKSLKSSTFITPIQEIYLHVMDPDKRKKWLETNLQYIGVSSKDPLLESLKKLEKMLDDYKESELSTIRFKLLKFIKRIEKSSVEIIQKSPIEVARSPTKATRSPVKASTSPFKTPKSSLKSTTSPMRSIRNPLGSANSPGEVNPLVRRVLFTDDSKTSPQKIKLQNELIERKEELKSPSVKASPSSLSRRALFKDGLRTSAQKGKLQSEFAEARRELLDFLNHDFLKVCLKSLDDIPLGELFIYDDSETIERLVDPIPRTALHNALETPTVYIECECCKQNSRDQVLKTMPDLSTVFKLHMECGNAINLYDWFQAFRIIVDKKTFDDNDVNREIYARFILALRDLQFLGYISSVKKKSSGKELVTKYAYF